MLSWFERLVDPFPDARPATPPHGFFAFLWAATRGLRGVARRADRALGRDRRVRGATCSAMLGSVVDWLAKVQPAKLWAEEGARLLLLAGDPRRQRRS